MKILLLNDFDSGSGSAIAAERLFSVLRKNNVDAKLGVIKKKTANSEVILLAPKKNLSDHCKLFRFIKRLFRKIESYIHKIEKNRFHTTNAILHSKNQKTLIDIDFINSSDYDLIHLHWVNHNMISIEDIAKIKKPVIWTLHDSWPFCGAEHHPNVIEDDTRFIDGYKKNNKPKTTSGPDICRKTWERKRKAWKNSKFNFIAPSDFMWKAFSKSALFRDSSSSCVVIPNIVPENIFRALDKNALKELFQIPTGKKIIGFGAAFGVTDKKSIKGGHLLVEALKKIDNHSDYFFVVFGNDEHSLIKQIGLPTFVTGFISNSHILAAIYNVCDVFVCPSLLENLPNVCLESLFCGTPVAAFDTGGIPDIVEHKKTGYLAKCFDPEDLYNGILYCIDNYDQLSGNALKKMQTEFPNDVIAKKHIELYESVLKTYSNASKQD